ncbi:MAG: hypothetical protein LBR80_11590 [Deltaproteobacteria bacterium]|jgi:hypothetical protein|nr:hypothetical protein [Deltaproteobacteria bacterium]
MEIIDRLNSDRFVQKAAGIDELDGAQSNIGHKKYWTFKNHIKKVGGLLPR